MRHGPERLGHILFNSFLLNSQPIEAIYYSSNDLIFRHLYKIAELGLKRVVNATANRHHTGHQDNSQHLNNLQTFFNQWTIGIFKDAWHNNGWYRRILLHASWFRIKRNLGLAVEATKDHMRKKAILLAGGALVTSYVAFRAIQGDYFSSQ